MTTYLNEAPEISTAVRSAEGAPAARNAPALEPSWVVAGLFERSEDGAPVSLAEMIARDFGPETPRSEYEEELDLLGTRAEFLASDGSEGVEWTLEDGSIVRHSEVDGWSMD
jgi:hypothetical protein